MEMMEMAKKNLITGKEINEPVKADVEDTDALKAELEALRRELANAQAKSNRPKGGLTFKVSQKGCVSVYGMGRYPFSLYKSQWMRLLQGDEHKALKAFIKENDDILPEKGAPKAK